MRLIRPRSVVTADGLVVALRPLDPNAPWLPAWHDLSRRPLVDNLFYDPAFALPASGAFGRGVQVALVGDRPRRSLDCVSSQLGRCGSGACAGASPRPGHGVDA